MKKLLTVVIVICFLSGCTALTRTVYVPQGDAVKLRETLKNVDVWIKPSKPAEPIAGNMTLYEGWY